MVSEALSSLFEDLILDRISEVTIDSLFKLVDVLRCKDLILLQEPFYNYWNHKFDIFGIDIGRLLVNDLDRIAVSQLVVVHLFAFCKSEPFMLEHDVLLVQAHVLTTDHFSDLLNCGVLFDV